MLARPHDYTHTHTHAHTHTHTIHMQLQYIHKPDMHILTHAH